jgi:CheY-like chemotaxis protein
MKSHRLVLLVEDDQDDLALTVRALGKRATECEIVVARNGVQALELLGSSGADAGSSRRLPHLILLDLRLPAISGFDVLRLIRRHARTRYVPVVVISASSAAADILKSYELGANSYIHKPIDFVQFAQVVQSLCAYWLTLNELPSPPSES